MKDVGKARTWLADVQPKHLLLFANLMSSPGLVETSKASGSTPEKGLAILLLSFGPAESLHGSRYTSLECKRANVE